MSLSNEEKILRAIERLSEEISFLRKSFERDQQDLWKMQSDRTKEVLKLQQDVQKLHSRINL